jgi:hypothetical protein
MRKHLSRSRVRVMLGVPLTSVCLGKPSSPPRGEEKEKCALLNEK